MATGVLRIILNAIDVDCRNFLVLTLFVAVIAFTAADEKADQENTLKCLVQFLETKGVTEEFFSSVDKRVDANVDCEYLMNVKLTRAYGKIHDKLKADSFFAKYATCIMNAIKTESNKVVILQREAIKLNGVGVKVWNYFSQKEHLDELKKKVESSINKAASERCVAVY